MQIRDLKFSFRRAEKGARHSGTCDPSSQEAGAGDRSKFEASAGYILSSRAALAVM